MYIYIYIHISNSVRWSPPDKDHRKPALEANKSPDADIGAWHTAQAFEKEPYGFGSKFQSQGKAQVLVFSPIYQGAILGAYF